MAPSTITISNSLRLALYSQLEVVFHIKFDVGKFYREAANIVGFNGTGRAAELEKCVVILKKMVQYLLDQKLGLWEKRSTVLRMCLWFRTVSR
ncbi:hypothetical protein QQ045_002332 [Rhodiola kirilowii]